MKQVNIYFENINKVLGPFYLITNQKELDEYWNTIRIPRFDSALQYLIASKETLRLPKEKFDHLLNETRIDYGEQKIISATSQFKKQEPNWALSVLNLIQKTHNTLINTFLSKNIPIIINELGEYQFFKKTEMAVTDQEVTDRKETLDLSKAIFNVNSKNTNKVLILENAYEVSINFTKCLWDNINASVTNSDIIYCFYKSTKEQLKTVLERIISYYDIICFETAFSRQEQVKSFIQMILQISHTKINPITFYVLSHRDIVEVIEENCTEEEKKCLYKHTYIMM